MRFLLKNQLSRELFSHINFPRISTYARNRLISEMSLNVKFMDFVAQLQLSELFKF